MYSIIHRTRKSDGVMHKPPWRTREAHTEDGVTRAGGPCSQWGDRLKSLGLKRSPIEVMSVLGKGVKGVSSVNKQQCD